ncbi:MAG: hypothetical protein C5B55_02310 [Blastocatellia bacterium]|nr:MAG: hypothetical protein C5B55_02310 [Blastocatellia bacterium]
MINFDTIQAVQRLAEIIWNYHRLNHELSKSDTILVLCSHDEAVAKRGAELFLDGWAPLLIFSGGLGAITKQLWTEPEAERFARIAIQMGVPENHILIERASTNTGENVKFTRKLLASKALDPQSFIVVQKPYMERRSYATFKKVWPEKRIIVTSPQVSFSEYLAAYSNRDLTSDDVISIMVGDLQRIREYPKLGYQIEQDIPDEVLRAFEDLVAAGFNRHLIRA